ncbi:GT2 family glycosyltransferase [Geodermatophilus normandii]|uniref:GT2 family glycosyltransferase n=1 Tax=Geodermatophilus normandii TaxID=1137989 RepID=A0A317QL23_9ACTN|nr:glycosyltransferase [Geodermatophilus normandii]PWW23594.1 GT2 family glycosyltransferase [Geodermatophilus normandii]
MTTTSPATAPSRHASADGVTVVVMSRDRREDLLATLPRHEAPVVLVDNGSTDGTVEAVRAALPQVTVLPLVENAGARARTIGAGHAGTEFVAFADDDSWWAPGDLARAAAVMRAHPRLAVLNARVLVGPEERLDPLCAELATSPLGTPPHLPGPRLLGFLGCAAMVRRDAFLAVGGFDPVVRFPGEEERLSLDLAAAGWDIAYVDAVTVHHHPSLRRHDPRPGARRSGGRGCSPRSCGCRRATSPGRSPRRCGPARRSAAGCGGHCRTCPPRCAAGGGCPGTCWPTCGCSRGPPGE